MFCVIFDMDGTLLDTQRPWIYAWDHAGAQQGYHRVGRLLPDACGMNEAGAKALLLHHLPQLDVVRFREDARQYMSDHLVVRCKEGAEELLAYLKGRGVPLGLATGTAREAALHQLAQVGLEAYFDALVCGDEIQRGKPAPDIFLKTAQLLGVDAADCYVFEDSENGARGAAAAGMHCCGVPDVKPFCEEVKRLLWREVTSLTEAKAFFEAM